MLDLILVIGHSICLGCFECQRYEPWKLIWCTPKNPKMQLHDDEWLIEQWKKGGGYGTANEEA